MEGWRRMDFVHRELQPSGDRHGFDSASEPCGLQPGAPAGTARALSDLRPPPERGRGLLALLRPPLPRLPPPHRLGLRRYLLAVLVPARADWGISSATSLSPLPAESPHRAD